MRQRLLDMGVLPDVMIGVTRVSNRGKTIFIKHDQGEIRLGLEEAQVIRVAVE